MNDNIEVGQLRRSITRNDSFLLYGEPILILGYTREYGTNRWLVYCGGESSWFRDSYLYLHTILYD